MEQLKAIIESAFERRADITPRNADTGLREAVNSALALLDGGEARVAEKKNGQWVVNEWLKKAVLLSFRINDNAVIRGGDTNYYDKVPMKYADYNSRDFQESGVRVVPPAAVRKGAYIAPNVVLMPSYVNIGAYVDSGTMVDTWATVGSCAQIGKNVHLSGGVDIGQSTRIYNRETGEISYGRIPAGSVVVSGNLPSKDGKYSLYCAVIVKQVVAKTLGKVGIYVLLRGI